MRRRAGYGRKPFGLMGAAPGRTETTSPAPCARSAPAWPTGARATPQPGAIACAAPFSTHASHVAVDARHLLAQPARIAPVQLATLPYNFLTVRVPRAGRRRLGLRFRAPGRTVLVHGGRAGWA
ncbi:hypothetical protein [Duganella sp. BJB1802]|uniref:hypothetical protein n=1 Tax=Duganella sp. BJB1802 TaxID=2744575 RepID=UPI001C3D8B5C|nr:hypothetical protein [Duganella sp. BJB1802]